MKINLTRELSYRKEDRAMRPIYIYTSKIWGVPGFANAPYSPKFLKAFCSHAPCEYTCQA